MSKNLNYKRGADKERKIVKIARESGCIAARSAGSHSPVDVWILNPNTKEIKIIQCKHTIKLRGNIEPKLKEKLEAQYQYLNGTYKVTFEAL